MRVVVLSPVALIVSVGITVYFGPVILDSGSFVSVIPVDPHTLTSSASTIQFYNLYIS